MGFKFSSFFNTKAQTASSNKTGDGKIMEEVKVAIRDNKVRNILVGSSTTVLVAAGMRDLVC